MEIIELLEKYYPDVDCTLNYTKPYELLIATILAAQCTDLRVNKVTSGLFKKYDTIERFANADILELEKDVMPTGFFRNKAKNIKAAALMLRDMDFPDTMEELLKIPGVGRKTANVILAEIFHKPAVIVDTHTKRLANRLGLVNSDNPTIIERQLIDIIPSEKQTGFCHRLVNHGRIVCRAIRPDCLNCFLRGLCKYNILYNR